MAGHINIQKLEKPLPSKLLVEGLVFWKWEDSDSSPKRFVFKVDQEGFFLYARGDDPSQSASIWDLTTVSDVRFCRSPLKDSKLSTSLRSVMGEAEIKEDCIITVVIREDGITKLSKMHLLHTDQEKDKIHEFMSSINCLAHNLLDFNASVSTYFRKHYVRILLEANRDGQLTVRKIQKLMMVPKSSKQILDILISAKTDVKQLKDGGSYVTVAQFTYDIFINMVDSLLQNRGPDLDVLKGICNIKAKKQYITVKEFVEFLNTQQRDPRLNTILYPYVTPEQAKVYLQKYGQDSDRLTMKDLLVYLQNDENLIFDPTIFDRFHDMNRPLNHYFINSSHNSYLNGHQLRSESLAEMYIQVLLTGCRCVELDCWPSGDNEEVLITHGNTLCTKITFKEVVEAINDYAFVVSDYPVILSIENHCNRYPKLIKRMADIFIEVFGDKLLSQPLEDFPLDKGKNLPPPDSLRRKILIKDKVRLSKGGQFTSVDATLPRGSNVGLTGISEVQMETLEKDAARSSSNATDTENISTRGTEKSLSKETTIFEEEVKNDDKTFKKDESSKVMQKDVSLDSQKKIQNATSVENTDGTNEKEEKAKYESGEASASGPLNQLLNYCTAMSFQSFEACEELNCSFIMSSFHEEKGLGFIRSKPKDFVRYNLKQNSRVYPAGSRIASSNYMPQLFWNVGCQMVALNFQTSDMPMQVNYAKFEANMGSGYLLKPSVLRADKGFNPFIQRKLEDIVPARLSVKIISGMFVTKKSTSLMVELEMYGLPADLVRRQYTKKKSAAPHPFWNEDYFVFKRILLPELALLRLAVLDDDHTVVGQRVLPVEHLRAGFRHITLRNKHNFPLGLSSLFVHIKIEDYVPDEYEDFAAALENPMKFVSRALEMMTLGTKEDGDEESDSREQDCQEKTGHVITPIPSTVPSTTPEAKQKDTRKPSITPPELVTQSSTLKQKSPIEVTGKQKLQTLNQAPIPGQESKFTSLKDAHSRKKFTAMQHTDARIIEHAEYLKVLKGYSKSRAKLMKKQEDELRKAKVKQEKELKKLAKASQEKVVELQESHKESFAKQKQLYAKEMEEFEKQSKAELHEKQAHLLQIMHKQQRKELEKIHKSDLTKVQVEIAQELKQMKKDSSGTNNKEYHMKGIEERLFSIGMQTRSDLDTVHKKEESHFKETCEEALANMKENHIQEMEHPVPSIDI